MKRKRGHKKGKSKKSHKIAKTEATPNVSSANNTEDNYNNEDDYGNDEYESPMEVDTPSSNGTDQQISVLSQNPEGSNDKNVEKPVGRVKVKLKPSKVLDSSHSDTDRSSSQMGLERQGGVSDKIEDGAISLTEMKMGISGSLSKKTGSIKIKSSSSLSGSTVSKTPSTNKLYNREELDSALTVIKKIMKMEAAAPFNVPVNPEALGIPDYFDIIDTPMDFGTICSNIENGDKYKNSEDVFKDVQYIWENCSKYNNKGDYILELMKRVKKNFMKYWVAAGLYSDQSKGNNDAEGIQGEDAAQSSQGKTQVKGSQSKSKSGKRHGRRHKHDCLCAICILKRRKREREEQARIAKGQTGDMDAQESKQEESSLLESAGGEDSSSDMGESRDLGGDDEVEKKRVEMNVQNTEQQYINSHVDEKHGEDDEGEEDEEDEEEDEGEEDEGREDEEEENEMESQKRDNGETREQSQSEGPNRESEPGTEEKSTGGVATHTQGREVETAAILQQKVKDAHRQEEKAKMYDKFRVENPMLLSLCGKLFPNDHKSVWSGPHSLVRHQDSARITSSICAAIDTLMQ